MKRGIILPLFISILTLTVVLYVSKTFRRGSQIPPPAAIAPKSANVTVLPPTTSPVAEVDCCSIKFDIEPLCNGTNRVVIGNCSCVDILLCRMVAVTSLSSNHFNEARDYFGSLQLYYPRTKIVVYDLGLSEDERRTLKTYCNVAEIRPFRYEKYPAHVRSLLLYSWKPLVVQEASKDFEVILYGDSSVRMLSSDMSPAIRELIKFPFLSGSPHGRIVALTHEGMIKYLHSPSRYEMRNFDGTQGGVWIMWANSLMKRTMIPEWADCALHMECIAPEGGTQLWTCQKPPTQQQFDDAWYIGCHRYDQSAISMILARDFGVGINKQIAQVAISDTLWFVDREGKKTHTIKTCK